MRWDLYIEAMQGCKKQCQLQHNATVHGNALDGGFEVRLVAHNASLISLLF